MGCILHDVYGAMYNILFWCHVWHYNNTLSMFRQYESGSTQYIARQDGLYVWKYANIWWLTRWKKYISHIGHYTRYITDKNHVIHTNKYSPDYAIMLSWGLSEWLVILTNTFSRIQFSFVWNITIYTVIKHIWLC